MTSRYGYILAQIQEQPKFVRVKAAQRVWGNVEFTYISAKKSEPMSGEIVLKPPINK